MPVLTREQLIALQRSMEDRQVLSVYVDGRASDPAARHAWRATLAANLDSVRRPLGDDATQRDFDRCREHLLANLADVTGALRSKGWVAFVTTDGVVLAEHLPVVMPNAVHWTRGPWVSPYVRAQKELRPVFLVVVDARSARLYQYSDGTLTSIANFHAHAHLDEPAHMGSSPRPHFHPGTRGTTGTDAASRARREGTERMLREMIDQLAQLATGDAAILIGGMPAAAREAMLLLPDELRSRTSVAQGLNRITPRSSLRRAAASGAMKLRRARDASLVSLAVSRAAENGRGTTGVLDTRTALSVGGVHMLLVSLDFSERHPDAAEEMTRLALGQQATVEIVAGDAADPLDVVGGVAATLRYPTPSLRPSAEAPTEAALT
jgi:release factor family 10